MPHYVYTARTTTQQLIEGSLEAESETAAIIRLGTQGVFPLSITLAERPAGAAAAESQAPVAVRGRVSSSALGYISRQLADLLGGGLPLFNALTLLGQQTEHKVLRGVIGELGNAVRDGQSFSEALAQHPTVFPPLYTNMIRAGEAGGSLDAVLNRLADLLESESEFRSRISSALIYPSMVLVVGVLTVLVLLTYVVPKLTSMFTESGQLLPLPTRILLGLSDGLVHWWWLAIGGAVGAAAALRIFRRSLAGRQAIDRIVLVVPLVGTLTRKIQTARFTRNLGVMIGQGVAMLMAIDVASSTVSNATLRQAMTRLRDAVQGGDSLSSALASTGQFPPLVVNLVAVGEESGTLETALIKIAATYERESDRALRVLTTVLEPLLIVIVGLVVMFIVIATLLPIFQLGLVVQ